MTNLDYVMASKFVWIDGAETTIRPMGEDYLMADAEPDGITVDLTCRASAKAWPNPIYSVYYRKLTDAYGAAAILAWQDTAVVGFLPFKPHGFASALPHCIHYVPGEAGVPDESELTAIQRATPVAFGDLDPKVLVVQCASVKPELRGKGLGTAMASYLVDWARERGWERIQGSAFIDGDWGWLPNVEFWEGVGFTRGADAESTLEFGPSCGFHIDLAT